MRPGFAVDVDRGVAGLLIDGVGAVAVDLVTVRNVEDIRQPRRGGDCVRARAEVIVDDDARAANNGVA